MNNFFAINIFHTIKISRSSTSGQQIDSRLFQNDFHNPNGLLSHLTELTHFDISSNAITVDTGSVFPQNLFENNLKIEQVLLENNNITPCLPTFSRTTGF